MIILRLPPLRERGDDILFLAEHFLRRFNAKYGKAGAHGIDPRARELLLAYPWPGNVRELSHVIERAVLWSRGDLLDSEHLSLEIPATAGRAGASGRAGRRSLRSSLPASRRPAWTRVLGADAHRAGAPGIAMATRPGRPSDSASAETRCATG